MNDCTFCGASNPYGAGQCRDCGAALSQAASPPAADQRYATTPAAASAAPGMAPVPGAFATGTAAAFQPIGAIPPLQPLPPAQGGGTGGFPAPPAAPALSAPLPIIRNLRVVIERSGRDVLSVPATKNPLLVGRADLDDQGRPVFPDVDVTDADPTLAASRQHARLTLGGPGQEALIEDLGSSNGTYVEGVGRLQPGQPTPLAPGARAMLGRGGPVLRVEPTDQRAAAAPGGPAYRHTP